MRSTSRRRARSLGQLASVTSADTTSTYAYGPTGMRERAVVASSAESTTTDYAWTGARLGAMRVTHASETTGGALTTVTDYRFVYGPDSLPLEMIVTEGGGAPASYAFQCDRAGSVVALTEGSGTVVASYSYDPYGRLLATGGSDQALAGANPLRYRGYYYDVATALYYLQARYYDPAVARFLSPDPAGPSAGDPLSLNRYAYCVGDPVNASDPSGAVIDIDGDGRISGYESADYASRHTSNERLRKYFSARSKALYYGSSSDKVSKQFAGKYATEAAVYVSGALPRDLQALMPDESKYGRSNLNCALSFPDDRSNGMAIFGAGCDVAGTTGIGGFWMFFGSITELNHTANYAQEAWEKGEITYGDLWMTRLSVFPGLGTAIAAGTNGLGNASPELFHWAEPYTHPPYR
ncbi:MAG: RHS repeat-associated core domain-containing protein [Coriobacteriia bacterium]